MPFDRDLRELLRAVKSISRSPADNIRRAQEDELAILERHVGECREHIARQRSIVLRMRERGMNAELAESLLAEFEGTLEIRLVRLARLKKAAEKDEPARQTLSAEVSARK